MTIMGKRFFIKALLCFIFWEGLCFCCADVGRLRSEFTETVRPELQIEIEKAESCFEEFVAASFPEKKLKYDLVVEIGKVGCNSKPQAEDLKRLGEFSPGFIKRAVSFYRLEDFCKLLDNCDDDICSTVKFFLSSAFDRKLVAEQLSRESDFLAVSNEYACELMYLERCCSYLGGYPDELYFAIKESRKKAASSLGKEGFFYLHDIKNIKKAGQYFKWSAQLFRTIYLKDVEVAGEHRGDSDLATTVFYSGCAYFCLDDSYVLDDIYRLVFKFYNKLKDAWHSKLNLKFDIPLNKVLYGRDYLDKRVLLYLLELVLDQFSRRVDDLFIKERFFEAEFFWEIGLRFERHIMSYYCLN